MKLTKKKLRNLIESEMASLLEAEFDDRVVIKNSELERLGAQIRDAENQKTTNAEFAVDVLSILQDYIR